MFSLSLGSATSPGSRHSVITDGQVSCVGTVSGTYGSETRNDVGSQLTGTSASVIRHS